MDKLWPWLPVEIYTHILTFLPPSRSLTDQSIDTLVACLSANSHIRAAARVSAIWEPHYRTRYTTCVEEWEAARREAFNENWYEMYTARRLLDKKALGLVDGIRVNPSGRHAKAVVFTQELSFDVWDVLDLEAQLPVPACFCVEDSTGSSAKIPTTNSILTPYGGNGDDADIPPNALPRRFWAKTVMGVIARSHALRFWTALYSRNDVAPPVTFEQVLTGFSSFFDESPKKVSCASFEMDICFPLYQFLTTSRLDFQPIRRAGR